MCLIAHRPLGPNGRGSHIPNDVIDTALLRHPDGFGVAWRKGVGADAVLTWEKFGPNQRKQFRRLLKRLDRQVTTEYVAHFRYATQGKPCVELSHPYEYEDPEEGTVLVFHNGIIDIDARPSESDTLVFTRDVLAHLPSAWWRNPGITKAIEMATEYSKLVLMTRTETVNLNKSDGTVDNGLWYSSNHKSIASNYNWGPLPDSGSRSVTDEDMAKMGWVKTPSGAWRKDAQTGVVRDNGTTSIVPYREATGHDIETERYTRWLASSRDTLNDDEWDDPRPHAKMGGPAYRHEYEDGGHALTPLVNISKTHDTIYPDAILCDECYTIGDVHIVQGYALVDIKHKFGELAEEVTGA